MQDTAKNLAFLSRRVSALEKKVHSLESTVAENTVLIERLSEVVELTLNNQKYFKEYVARSERFMADIEKYYGTTCALK